MTPEPVPDGRGVLNRAFRAALDGASAESAVDRFCSLCDNRLELKSGESLDLSAFARIWVIGAGKASPHMASGALRLLGERVEGGTIATKDGHAVPLDTDIWEAGHPVPDVRGLAAASEALRLARATGAGDLLLCLLSGGASALWTAPATGLSLADLQCTTDLLLRAGAEIEELNTVRKHLSRIAGGRLARVCGADRVLTLAVSDVLGDRPDVIGSGPTVPDPTTFGEALHILRDRTVRPPPAVRNHLESGAAGLVEETPGVDDPTWSRTSFYVIASLSDAVAAAAAALRTMGFRAEIVTEGLTGEARQAGSEIARHAIAARRSGLDEPLALIWGGETTVTVVGRGKGGRNQEMALSAAIELRGQPNILIGCMGTDGTDGPTDAAGAFADGGTVDRATRIGLDAAATLDRNDSYTLLKALGDLIVTGPTGTNVNDLAIALIAPSEGPPSSGR